MHGPAPAAPPHRPASRRTVVLLRVVFVALAVLSIGFLAWLTLLRAALVQQRRPLGWWVFGADLVLVFAAILLASGQDENSWQSNVAVVALLLQMAGAVVYYLVVDIRAQRVPPEWPQYGAVGTGAGYGATGAGYGYPGPAAAGYGYPRPETAGYGYPGPAQAPAPAPAAPNPYAGVQPPHQPPPASPYPAQPQRIDRVRAELDELSDYLRKEEGR
ncbi:hypothetical protein OEIGOIKO_04950 [Streptomyces chrestomyceticus JCM 4735]|uniref:Integral membrane protein n=1 Tax=Streptomyces chrestomyceticus JCM 4735 TaxID=1306181 RepID=A0A7U9KXI3_9ACTN|nr:hypothetical protein [Streptomyces chrestomyceticus]GCD37166.1 hypothetical protein OEIGOIKO_04950 [Streptomyces chrestomyceticus JCM 4735]